MTVDKEKSFVSVVVYIHDSMLGLADFFNGLWKILENYFEQYEIIFVDDASSDESVAMIHDLAEGITGTVQIIHMSYYQGQELAMNAGRELAIGDFVFEFDSTVKDYPWETVMQVYRHSLEGFDIVSAVPRNATRYSSRVFYRLYNRFSRSAYTLQTERFRILSRRVINRINSMSRTIPYRKAIYANCGLPQDTVIYEIAAGRSFSPGEADKYRCQTAVDALVLFTDIGYKMALLLTLGMVVISFLVALYAIFIFMMRQPISGWTSMILFLSVGFAGLFAVSAIVIKYLDVLLGLVFTRRNYTIEGIEKITR